VTVIVSSGGSTPSLALSVGAPGASCTDQANNAMDLDDDNSLNNNDYVDNALGDDTDNDDKNPERTGAPRDKEESAKLRKN
jgi:hypothetical protein